MHADAEADRQQTQIRMHRIFGNIKTKMTPRQKKMVQEEESDDADGESADDAEDDEEESAGDKESGDDEDYDHDHVAGSPAGHDGDGARLGDFAEQSYIVTFLRSPPSIPYPMTQHAYNAKACNT